MAMKLKQSLVKHGKVQRGLLGVTTQDLSGDLVKAFGLKSRHGAIISKIQANSPAQRAGLEPGDIILYVNGEKVKNSSEIRNIIGLLQVGERVEMEVLRGDEMLSFNAVIGKQQRLQVAGDKIHGSLQGAVLSSGPKDKV